MKKSKVLALAGVSLLSVGVLAACSSSSKGKSEATSYNYVYTADPETLDYVTSGKASTADFVTNGVDGLLENDQYGNFVPSIAESWTVSKDGLTYTYKIRKDAKWYTSEGEEYGDVTAQDFVTGLKHAADKKSEALYLVQQSVKGLDDYVNGKITDFSTVGVKAVDDHTLQYTLNQPEPQWNSKTTSQILWPVNAEFLKKQGDKFGQSTDPSSILYNGPFLMKSITAKSAVEYQKNENYWDKENVHIDTIKLAYFDGQDQDALARNFKDGAYTVARVYPTSSNYAGIEKDFKDNIYFTSPAAGVGVMSVNIDRQSYNHTSKTTDAQKSSTKKAILNKDFRQALNFAIDRKSYSAQINGEEGAPYAIRNTYVPPTFVQAGEKSFGDLVEEKLDTLGEEWKGVQLEDGQDGIFNAEKAKAEFAKAKAALQAEGVEFPIHLDLPVSQTAKPLINRAQSLKQSVEKTLGAENVVVDIQQMAEDDLYNITYYAPNAAAEDWDISVLVGWNPDYQDPSTYLDILKTTSTETTKTYLGFEGADNAAAKQVGLDEFDRLVNEAGKETSDVVTRYEKYAAAQAWLTDNSLVVPLMANPGAAPFISRIEPFSGAYAQTGNKTGSTYFKRIKVQNEVVTKKDYEAARKKWLKEKEESNAKAQKDLESHVE